jgi:hypothetical protein
VDDNPAIAISSADKATQTDRQSDSNLHKESSSVHKMASRFIRRRIDGMVCS